MSVSAEDFDDGQENCVPHPSTNRACQSPRRLLAIDSFLVNAGRMPNRDQHRRRFLAAVAEVCPQAAENAQMAWTEAAFAVPDDGRWFPRCELWSTGEVCWRWRPAPKQAATLRVAATPLVDCRKRPKVKGYDLDWLREATTEGSDRVLVGDDGSVRETTTAALVVWRAPNLPVVPEGPSLFSTTRLWFERRWGPLCRARVGIEELAHLEVWALNALHGPRLLLVGDAPEPVSGSLAFPARLAAFGERWHADLEPVL